MTAYLKHIALSAGIGFLGAFLLCLSKAHHFDATCMYDGFGVVGTSMASYLVGLQLSAPGKVQLPADFALKLTEHK